MPDHIHDIGTMSAKFPNNTFCAFFMAFLLALSFYGKVRFGVSSCVEGVLYHVKFMPEALQKQRTIKVIFSDESGSEYEFG